MKPRRTRRRREEHEVYNLLSSAVQMAGGGLEDARILRYRVRSLDLDTRPPMLVLADGFSLGEELVRLRVRQRTLTVMAGEPPPGATV